VPPFALKANSPAGKAGEWGMIVYGGGSEYPYMSIPQYEEICPCFCRFIPYLGAILWYVVV